MQCDRCGEEDTSKLVTYGLKFSRDAVFCAKCAMIEIPLKKNSIKSDKKSQNTLDGPRTVAYLYQ